MKIKFLVLIFTLWVAVFPLVVRGQNVVPRFELLHLWSTSVEKTAFQTLSLPLKAQGVVWSEAVVFDNFLGVAVELAERVSVQDPPTGVFWIGGFDLRKIIEVGIFRNIENTNNDIDFSTWLRPEIYKVLNFKNGITALPLAIHIQNHAVYNKEIFHSLGLKLPKNWAEFLSSAEKIKAAGYIPLSMSDQQWQIRFLFSSVLAEFFTFRQFEAFLSQNKKIDYNDLRKSLIDALHVFGQLRQYVNPQYADALWTDTVNLLLTGQAASSFLGDFSSPLLENDGRFVCDIAPGNRYLLWSFDVIALVEDVNYAEQLGQKEFIKVATNLDYIAQYTQKKGGIPVYESIQVETLNFCSQQGVSVWNQTPHKIRLNFANWQQALNSMAMVAQSYWRDPSKSAETSADNMIRAFESFKGSAS